RIVCSMTAERRKAKFNDNKTNHRRVGKAVSGLVCGALDHVPGGGLFHQGGAEYVASFQPPLRHERLAAPDRRHLHHYHSRGLYAAADFDSAAAVRPHAADSAARGPVVWISDGFCAVGSGLDSMYRLLAAVAGVPGRD